MKQSIQVLLAMQSFAGGGAERVVVSLANRFVEMGQGVTLVVFRNVGPYREEVDERVRIIDLDIKPSIRNVFLVGRRLKNRLLSEKIDVIVSSLTSVNRIYLRLKWLRLVRVPLIVVEQNNASLQLRRLSKGVIGFWIRRLELRILYRQAERIVGVSKGVSMDFQNLLRGERLDIRTVENPVNLEQINRVFDTKPDEPFADEFLDLERPVLLAVGRLNPQKAFDELIEAFSLLPQESAGSLVILGEGDKRGDLERMALKMGVSEKVKLPGFSSNPWWFMKRADLFVLSSHWEGFPLVLLEALACGCRVVATDCPFGPSEILGDSDAGILVPVGDVRRLEKAISESLSREFNGDQHQASARLCVERFSIENVAARYLEVIEECINSR